MMKKLIKQYLIQVYEVDTSVTINKTEMKEDLAKIVSESIEREMPEYIPDAEYNDYVKVELPKLLKEKYRQYKLNKEN